MKPLKLGVAMAAVIALMAVPANANPRQDAKERRQALESFRTPTQAAIIDNGETKENFEQTFYSHFGAPSVGRALIQTWVEPDWTNFEAVDIQAAAQVIKVFRVQRIAFRVELYGDDQLLASSTTNNTGDTAVVSFVQSPETGPLNTADAPCLFWSVVFYSIRWPDGSLTSGKSLTAPGSWVNPVCSETPLSDLRAR
jgi:hypothetical protein